MDEPAFIFHPASIPPLARVRFISQRESSGETGKTEREREREKGELSQLPPLMFESKAKKTH